MVIVLENIVFDYMVLSPIVECNYKKSKEVAFACKYNSITIISTSFLLKSLGISFF